MEVQLIRCLNILGSSGAFLPAVTSGYSWTKTVTPHHTFAKITRIILKSSMT